MVKWFDGLNLVYLVARNNKLEWLKNTFIEVGLKNQWGENN